MFFRLSAISLSFAVAAIAVSDARADVVVSDAFAGYSTNLEEFPILLDVNGDGADDLLISVAPVKMLERPPSDVTISVNDVVEVVPGEVATISGLTGAGKMGLSRTSIATIPQLISFPLLARPYAPGETVDGTAFYADEALLYTTDPAVPLLETETAFEMAASAFGPLFLEGSSAFFGFQIETGAEFVDASGLEPSGPELTYGWIELSRGSVVVGNVGLQNVPFAGAPVPSEVPLPAAGLLLLGGLAGMGALRARRRARA